MLLTVWAPDQQQQPHLVACGKCRVAGSIPNLFIRVCILAAATSDLYTPAGLRSAGLREHTGQAEAVRPAVRAVGRGGRGRGLSVGAAHLPSLMLQSRGKVSSLQGFLERRGLSLGNHLGVERTLHGCPPFRIMLSVEVTTNHNSLLKLKVIEIKYKLKFRFLSFIRQILGAQ